MRLPFLRIFGLIGYPLGHSFSQKFFLEKFQREGIESCHYELFPLEKIEELPYLLHFCPHIEGLNVTIPYKERVLPFLDDIDPEAAEVGAVNVIKIKKGRLAGYNTDIFGFEKSLLEFFSGASFSSSAIYPHPALILGTGGASKAVVYVLKKLGIAFRCVSRKKKEGLLTYEELTPNVLASHRLVINTTPLGTFPNPEECAPLLYDFINETHLFYDLVYNPEKTQFLKNAEARGARTCNGLKMLHLQAERAWEIWNQVHS